MGTELWGVSPIEAGEEHGTSSCPEEELQIWSLSPLCTELVDTHRREIMETCPERRSQGADPRSCPILGASPAALDQDQDLEDLRMGHLISQGPPIQGTFLSSGVYTRELCGPGVHSLIQTLRGLVLQGGGFMSV